MRFNFAMNCISHQLFTLIIFLQNETKIKWRTQLKIDASIFVFRSIYDPVLIQRKLYDFRVEIFDTKGRNMTSHIILEIQCLLDWTL